MSLVKRKPRKLIRLSKVAKQIGYQTRWLKEKALENGIALKRLNDARQSPDMIFERDAEILLEKLGV